MNAGLPFVFACCAGTSGAPKADVQFYGSLLTYVKRYGVMMNNNISSDGKARLSMQHVRQTCEARWQHRVLCSSHIGVGCTYHNSFIIAQPQISRCHSRDVCYVSTYLPAYSVRFEVVSRYYSRDVCYVSTYWPAYSVRIEIVLVCFTNGVTIFARIRTCLALNAYNVFVYYVGVLTSMQLVLASTFFLISNWRPAMAILNSIPVLPCHLNWYNMYLGFKPRYCLL